MKESLKKYIRYDLLLIVLLLLIGTVLFFALRGAYGARVLVMVDNEVVEEYPLSIDGEFLLPGGKNTLVIENGAACIRESRCPDHLCERQGRIMREGERIVCLPHHLTVKIS